jgi:DNA-3-methyladenine glycosylase I
VRCFGDGDALYSQYHDSEWGLPVTAEQGLFERICLEGMQAGLSWILVLRRRDQLRSAFAGFDPDRLCRWDPSDVDRVLDEPGVIRSRPKCAMVVRNAQATVDLRSRGGLGELVWSARPAEGPGYEQWAQVPASTVESRALARSLKAVGFTFVGPVSAYSLMQAAGLVDDHLTGCPVRPAVERARASGPAAR